jgi:anti-sigma factor RsiW
MSGNSTAGWPDDETLLAFADGRLDAENAARVARHLETNIEARRTVVMYRRTGELATRAFDEAMHVQASPALMSMLSRETDIETGNRSVVPLRQRSRSAPVSPEWRLMPLAASIVLIVGGLFALLMFRSVPPEATSIALGAVERGSALERLLETKATGVSETVPVGTVGAQKDVTLILTFRDRLQRPCREFESAPHGGNSLDVAVACRNADGGWTIEGAAHIAATTESAPPNFSPAGGNAAMALESVLKVLGATPAITPDEETLLISAGWKK